MAALASAAPSSSIARVAGHVARRGWARDGGIAATGAQLRMRRHGDSRACGGDWDLAGGDVVRIMTSAAPAYQHLTRHS